MSFVWFHIIWFGGWILFNMFGPVHFDPYPYQFLTLVVSLEAIFLSTFILISQNLDSKLSEARNKLGLQVSILNEQENIKIIELLLDIKTTVNDSAKEDVDDVIEDLNNNSIELINESKEVS
jgi:uncharacterized membrane protein